jgi:HTH-type transcriptional regulator / antitoxin HigA
MTATYAPAEVFPPGEYLRDELDEREWTITEFAEIIDRPVQAVSEIVNGKKEITTETAVAFADALGTTAELWLNLQTNYRLFNERTRTSTTELNPVQRRARLRNAVPLADIRRRGWIVVQGDLETVEREVLALLDIRTFDGRPSLAMAARRSNSTEPLSPAQTAWLAYVRRVARAKKVSKFNAKRLMQTAATLPQLLRDGPERLIDAQEYLAKCGVVLVFCEGLPGGKLDGAATVLANGTRVVALTGRGNRFDSLVFTLLHECAHFTLGHLDGVHRSIVDDDITTGSEPDEVAANEQASLWLFPNGCELASTSMAAVQAAASRYDVHPSVVIGRLQRDLNNWTLHRAKLAKVRNVPEVENLWV